MWVGIWENLPVECQRQFSDSFFQEQTKVIFGSSNSEYEHEIWKMWNSLFSNRPQKMILPVKDTEVH